MFLPTDINSFFSRDPARLRHHLCVAFLDGSMQRRLREEHAEAKREGGVGSGLSGRRTGDAGHTGIGQETLQHAPRIRDYVLLFYRQGSGCKAKEKVWLGVPSIIAFSALRTHGPRGAFAGLYGCHIVASAVFSCMWLLSRRREVGRVRTSLVRTSRRT